MRNQERKDVDVYKAVRDILAVEPLITFKKLSDTLQRRGLFSTGKNFDYSYLKKIINRINGELMRRIEYTPASARIVEIKERHRLVIDRLIRIGFCSKELYENNPSDKPTYDQQIRALELLVKLDLAVLSAEMDAGIFKRQLGEVNVNVIPIEQAKKQRIIEVLSTWGVIEKPAVDNHLSIETKPVDNESTANKL